MNYVIVVNMRTQGSITMLIIVIMVLRKTARAAAQVAFFLRSSDDHLHGRRSKSQSCSMAASQNDKQLMRELQKVFKVARICAGHQNPWPFETQWQDCEFCIQSIRLCSLCRYPIVYKFVADWHHIIDQSKIDCKVSYSSGR